MGATEMGGCGADMVFRFQIWHMPTAEMHISHQPRQSMMTGCASSIIAFIVRRPAGDHAYTDPSSHAAAKKFVLPVTSSTDLGKKSCHSDCPLLVQLTRAGS
jgi:hypothetical protein